MNKKQSKRQRNIRTKLMAAICMLLVSSIMMVSTTYAWFTLSTAPEVTGITTAVGANGNLEMALQPLSGDSSTITSGIGDTNKDAAVKNTTWGNLVDVSNNGIYGLDKITLNLAKLQTTTTSDGEVIGANYLSTPTYGADGRMGELENKSIAGVFNPSAGGGQFLEGFSGSRGEASVNVPTAYGVRAIGVASGMSDRQLAFRAALTAANTAASQAKRVASQSLNTNGAALADIAIKHATSDGNETYTTAELAPLGAIMNALLGTAAGTDGALEYIEEALIQYAKADALNKATDAEYATVITNFENATLANLSTKTSLTQVTNVITKLQNTISSVSTAKDTYGTLSDGATWTQLRPVLTALADPDQMQVNKIPVSELKGDWLYNRDRDGALPDGYTTDLDGYVLDGSGAKVSNMSRLVNAVLTDGIQLVMASGAGVYADIADFCGDYSAAVKLKQISYGGMTVNNLNATMSTKSSVSPSHLSAAQTAIGTFQANGGNSTSAAISDFYGYIIDLAFRTNVAGSNLQLQGEAVDRIYSDSTNENTMGHGATMSFKSATTGFTDNQVKSLMSSIRVVFFNTDNKVIRGYARLDMANAQMAADGEITATLKMTDEAGNPKDTQAIMALEQNTVHELSVLVYMDGEKVTNADVANAAQSMTGKMNLQFSSDATLVPMDYTALKEGNGVVATTPAPETVSVASVTGIEGATATAGYGSYAGQTGIGVVIMNGGSPVTSATSVTINGAPAAYANGVWFVTAASKPDSVTVVITP